MPSPTPTTASRPPHAAAAGQKDLVRICGVRVWPTAGLIFLGLALAATSCDGAISRWCRGIHLRGDIEGTLAVGELFGNGIGVLFVLLAVLALDRQPRVALRLACGAYLPGLFVSLLKSIVTRVRPNYLEPAQLHGWWCGFVDSFPADLPADLPATGYALQSFPSGHTATAAGLALALTWRYPRAAWLFLLMAVLTGFERILHQAHYLSDTLTAVAIALLITGGFVHHGITGWIFDCFESRSRSASNASTDA